MILEEANPHFFESHRCLAQAPLQFRKGTVTLTLEEIAKLSGGKLEGDSEMKITGAASLAEATAEEISFFNNPRYLPQLRKTRAAAVIVPPDFSEQISAAAIRVQNPAKAFELQAFCCCFGRGMNRFAPTTCCAVSCWPITRRRRVEKWFRCPSPTTRGSSSSSGTR